MTTPNSAIRKNLTECNSKSNFTLLSEEFADIYFKFEFVLSCVVLLKALSQDILNEKAPFLLQTRQIP